MHLMKINWKNWKILTYWVAWPSIFHAWQQKFNYPMTRTTLFNSKSKLWPAKTLLRVNTKLLTLKHYYILLQNYKQFLLSTFKFYFRKYYCALFLRVTLNQRVLLSEQWQIPRTYNTCKNPKSQFRFHPIQRINLTLNNFRDIVFRCPRYSFVQ